jgi:hypothetical protein
MEKIAIETDGLGGYRIRVVQDDGRERVYGGFPTWSDARAWVAERWMADLPTLPDPGRLIRIKAAARAFAQSGSAFTGQQVPARWAARAGAFSSEGAPVDPNTATADAMACANAGHVTRSAGRFRSGC